MGACLQVCEELFGGCILYTGCIVCVVALLKVTAIMGTQCKLFQSIKEENIFSDIQNYFTNSY